MSGFAAPGLYAPGELPPAFVAPSATSTLRLADAYYTSLPFDSPAGTIWEGRILGDITLEQGMALGGGAASRASIAFGGIELANADGYFDATLRDFTIDGRSVTIRWGEANGVRLVDFYDMGSGSGAIYGVAKLGSGAGAAGLICDLGSGA